MFYLYLLTVIFANPVKSGSECKEGAYCKYGEQSKDHDKPHFGR